MKKITKTRITQILNACKFNPQTPGPLKIISDVGNTDYYLNRAIEFIEQSKHEGGAEKECIQRAISLLALAVANEET